MELQLVVDGQRWNREGLPPWIRRLDLYEAEDAIRRTRRFCCVCLARSVDDPCRRLNWPKEGVEARAIPGGIVPLGKEDGFDHDIRLERFFNQFSPRGIIVWGCDIEYKGCFCGPYNEKVRKWVAKNLAVDVIYAIAQDADILLVAYQELNFSTIFGSPEIISGLEECFGGKEALEAEFKRFIDSGRLGIGDYDKRYDKKWAREFLLPMSGWKSNVEQDAD